MMKKRVIAILLVCTLLNIPVVFAEDGVENLVSDVSSIETSSDTNVEVLTLDRAIELALENSADLNDLAESVKQLDDAYDNAVEGSGKAADLYNDYLYYKSLVSTGEDQRILMNPVNPNYAYDYVAQMYYDIKLSTEDKKVYVVDEVALVTQFTYMFSGINKEQLYNNFVAPSNAYKDVYVMLINVKNQKKALEETLENGAKQAVYGVISAREGLQRSNEYTEVLKEKNDILKIKYSLGQVSKYELDKNVMDYRKAQLENQKIKRTVENAELMLNNMVGFPLDTVIEFNVKETPSKYSSIRTFDEYLEEALKNRNGIVIAELELKNAQEELELMKQFIIHENQTQRLAMANKLVEKEVAYEVAINDVTIDVLNAYTDLSSKFEELTIESIEFSDAKVQLSSVETMEKLGLATKLNLIEAKIGYDKAINDYESGIYNFNIALDTMERKTSVGIMSAGGM